MKKIEEIARMFSIEGKLVEIKELSGGNINSTYSLSFINEGKRNQYIFQRINTQVFKEPEILMQRIEKVTNHMKQNQNNGAQILQVVNTNDDKSYHICHSRNKPEYWRVYKQITNAISYNDMSEVPSLIKDEVPYIIGQAFGNFLRLVSDYPEDGLRDPIEHFHDTEYIYNEFTNDIKTNKAGRVSNCQEEIDFINQRQNFYPLFNNLVKEGKIKKRLNHNDTKINNVLICWESGHTSVIDLDTVMPGILSDPADALRSLINEAGEEEFNLDLITINFDILKSFIEGYASETADIFTETEIKNIANALHIITLELGMRFLKDYVNGDTYFKVNPKIKNHNLHRAKVQLKLAYEIEKHKKYIEDIIISTYQKELENKQGKSFSLNI